MGILVALVESGDVDGSVRASQSATGGCRAALICILYCTVYHASTRSICAPGMRLLQPYDQKTHHHRHTSQRTCPATPDGLQRAQITQMPIASILAQICFLARPCLDTVTPFVRRKSALGARCAIQFVHDLGLDFGGRDGRSWRKVATRFLSLSLSSGRPSTTTGASARQYRFPPSTTLSTRRDYRTPRAPYP